MSNVKVLVLTPEHVGMTLIVNGQFVFAEDIFAGGAAPVAIAAPLQAASIAGAGAAVTAQTAPVAGVKDFALRDGEQGHAAISRWLKSFILIDQDGQSNMNDIRDATPPSIIALYANEGSARGSVSSVVKKMVEEGVFAAPEGFGRKAPILEASRVKPADAQPEAQPAPAEPAVAETSPVVTPTQTAPTEPAVETAPVVTEAPAETPAANDEDTINSDDALALENLDDDLMDGGLSDAFDSDLNPSRD